MADIESARSWSGLAAHGKETNIHALSFSANLGRFQRTVTDRQTGFKQTMCGNDWQLAASRQAVSFQHEERSFSAD